MKNIWFYSLGSLALSYGVAMGFRMLAVVAPNDQVKRNEENIYFFH